MYQVGLFSAFFYNKEYINIQIKVFTDTLRNPFNHACLSTWKGPAIPELVLGGYPQVPKGTPPEYNLATVLTITIIVKNFKESKLLEPAMKWEERYGSFVSFIKITLYSFYF